MSKTCAACRSRKVRCDGATPVCGPCSKARRPLECEYASSNVAQAPKGPLLQKGNACYACRKKKKKCDAKRPFCSTCEAAGKEQECQYEEDVQRSLTKALMSRTRELEQRLAIYEGQQQAGQQQASTSSVMLERSVRESTPFLTAELSSFLSTVGSLQASSLGPFVPSDSNLTGLPTLGPSYLHDPSETQIGAEIISPATSVPYFPMSTSLHQLNDFRTTFLSHHRQLGISFPETKLHAIMTGDISGTYAHPVLIYMAQLMGCRLWQQQHHTTLSSTVELLQLQFVNQALSDTPDPVTRLQVHSVLAIYFLIKRHMHEGRDQLLQGARVALQYDLRFDSHTAETLQPLHENSSSDEAQEHICALSQLLYLDKAAGIVLNDPSLLNADYDEQFRSLPYMFPTISKNNLVVLRARSVALLQHCRRLSARWTEIILNIGASHNPSAPDAQMQWYNEYWDLLEEVSEHISTLNPSMLKSSFFRQREQTLTLKMCLIISLTASAELHRLLASHHTESRLRCIDTVFEIVGITKSLKDDDYIFLDPILGTCWSMVATVLNQERISPSEESSSLQWKSSFTVIMHSASRLGHTLPFMEDSVETINGVATFVDE